jgi:succinyl-CoA:acetate CoA-transferase
MSFDLENGCLQGDLPTTDPTTAADEVGPEDLVLVSGFGGVGYPKRVPEALAASSRKLALSVVSGGGVGGELDDQLVEAGKLARRYPFQTRRKSRRAINSGDIAFHDRHISRFGDEIVLGNLGSPDVAIIEAVALGEDWLVPSTSIGHTPSFIRSAKKLIVEVNHAQPLELARVHDIYVRDLPPNRSSIPLDEPVDRIGSPVVEFDPEKLVGIVETERADDPYTFRDPTEEDRAIGAHLKAFLESEIERNPMLNESVHLQFGVGSMGNALMGALEEIEFGDREVIYFGEVFQDGLLDGLDSGQLSGASATSLALSEEGQKRLFADIDRYSENVVLRPANISNNPALIERFGVVGINSTVEVDIYGNANATHLGGTQILNGIGGGGDFNRNSRLGIIALPSTASGGEISRVVPMTPHVDHTEHDFSIIVTEHGVADLRGLSPRERAQAIIRVADPLFREGLDEYRTRALGSGSNGSGNTPHDLETALSWHANWQG